MSPSPAGADPACTIAGLAGWWDGLWGIERYPEPALRTTSRRGPLVPGRAHHVVAGRRNASDFLFVDGELVTELHDPAAPRRPRSRAALATWNGHVHVAAVALHEI